MDIFRTIRSSFYDPAFYQRMRTLPMTRLIAPLALLSVAGIGILMLAVYFNILPFARGDFLASIESQYPSDLVLTITNGELSINQPQPYYVKNTLPALSGKDAPQYLVIFDGTDQLSTDLVANSTYLIVKKQFLISQGRNGQGQITPFSTMKGTTTIEREMFVGLVERARPYVAPAVIFGGGLLVLLLTFVASMLWIIGHMVYVLIPACGLFFFGKLRGIQMDYKESYRAALLASIPPAILFYLLSLLKVSLPLPFAYTFLLLIVAAMNLAAVEPTAAAEPDASVH